MSLQQKRASAWSPNSVNMGAAVGGALFGALGNYQTMKSQEELDKRQKEIDELKGRHKGEATTVLSKAQLFLTDMKHKVDTFQRNNPTLSTILAALTGAASGYASGSSALNAYNNYQAQYVPPNRRKLAHVEHEKQAGPAIDALNQIFTDLTPGVAGAAYGGVRGAYESPDPDMRLLAAILPALLTAGGAQLGSELGEIGGRMLKPFFKDPETVMTLAKAIAGVSGGGMGFRAGKMINEMIIPENRGRSPSEMQRYKEIFAYIDKESAEYRKQNRHRYDFGPSDNEDAFQGKMDNPVTQVDCDGSVPTNEGKQYRILLPSRSVPQKKEASIPTGYAYNYAQLPSVQNAYHYTMSSPRHYGFSSQYEAPKPTNDAPEQPKEESGGWKKWIVPAAMAAGGVALGVIGRGAWQQWNNRTQSMKQLMRMHGAEVGQELSALRALPQEQRDAIHVMAKNLKPDELLPLHQQIHFIEGKRDTSMIPHGVEAADALVAEYKQYLEQLRNLAVPVAEEAAKKA